MLHRGRLLKIIYWKGIPRSKFKAMTISASILRYRMQLFFAPIFLLLSLLPSNSFAGTVIHGAKSAGMGTAFVAIADDPSAIVHNPAGITQLTGTNTYGGTTFLFPSTTYTNPSGQSEDTKFQVFFPPNLFLVSDLKTKDMRLGIGIYSLLGIGGRKWSKDGLTRFSSTKSFIATLSVNPTIAYQVLPSLSIALGLDYMLARNEAERMIDQSLFGARDGEFNLKADGDGWGYNIGILFTPNKQLSLGLAYRSKIKVDFSGDVELRNIAPPIQPLFGGSDFRTDISSESTFPQIVSFGIAYRPTEKWTLGFDVEWVEWSSFHRSDLDFEDEVPQAGFTDTSTPLDWKDIWTIKVGAEYKVNERLALRGGYAHSDTSVPDHTLDASNPDSKQHNVSVGFGYKFKKIDIDFFYMAGFYEDRKVRNNILSGEYKNFCHFVGFGIGKRF
jgi:long-chain fatty acid transport protein